MIGRKSVMYWKGCGRTWSHPNFRVLFQLLLVGIEESYEKC
jgi:hypothetical protein